ncbi:DUF6480 family protein [Kitasatospora sp. NPDC048540]|uniref:DUF6480 family protein n=1 Tax=unclassified Kitasatospora TaxID=2633591 RepID=UPI0005398A69|nr:DUF6480 family protein [Kitasatospora sp. MBT63]
MTTAAHPARPVPRGPRPAETPEGESSTSHEISTPEAPELHNAWPGWAPLALISLVVLACVLFMVGRIFSI